MAALRAGIDIGTNTVLMLIAEVEGKDIRVVRDEVTVVRLGEGVDENSAFSPAAMDRAQACFTKYSKILKEHGVEQCRAVATSGSRDAENAESFFVEMQPVLGFPIEVISGEQEAELSFIGALSDKEKPENYAIIDIGGGSTEFVCKKPASGKLFGKSLDIGCVRMKERFLEHDPAKPEEIKALQSFIKETFDGEKEIWDAIQGKSLIGIAGTATYLSSTHMGLEEFDLEKVNGSLLSQDAVRELRLNMQKMTAEDRLGMGGMDAGRADVIVGGAVILEEALLKSAHKEIEISAHGLRYGLVLCCPISQQ